MPYSAPVQCRALWLSVALLTSGLAPLYAAPARRSARTRASSLTLAQRVVPVPEGQLSPDGRWLTFYSGKEGNRFNLYNIATRRTWQIKARHNEANYETEDVAWHPNGRLLAIDTSQGWLALRPYERRQQWIKRESSPGQSVAAWSPQGTRLAIFEVASQPVLLIWDGHKVVNRGNWSKEVKYPYGEERAWQAAWSPDGKKILFRFYGHAERDPDQPAHAFVFDPNTGHTLYNWGAEAAPAQWLDTERLVYSTGLFPSSLAVSKPRANIDNTWGPYYLWVVTSHRDAIYAIDSSNGLLRRTSTRVKHWRKVRRFALPKLLRDDYGWKTLRLSPRGDWLALESDKTSVLANIRTGRIINLKSASLLGWPVGQVLPLVIFPASGRTPWQVRQLSLATSASRR